MNRQEMLYFTAGEIMTMFLANKGGGNNSRSRNKNNDSLRW